MFPEPHEGSIGTTTPAARAAGARPHGGRTLDATRDDALREAALTLLAEIGYDRLTIDSVAARAGSGKATIYRRWSGKAELVVDALCCRKGTPSLPDTGSLRGDLAVFAQRSKGGDSELDSRVMIGLVSALIHDAELRQVVREQLVDPRTAALQQVFERAIARGEMSADRNLDLLASLLPALLLQHVLIVGEIPEAPYVERIINDVILPLATAHTPPA